jgi:NDP-sugar pyrophosphorylase family protein
MKAMLLAGGMSTRLYPLTKQVPKPLVPVAGEPNSGHLMRYLKSYGIDQVAINVFYLADKIVEAFGDGSRFGVKLEYLHEKVLSGSAGGVKQMEGFLRDSTFVVIGCDAITDVKLDELIAFHRERKAIATIGLYEADEVDQFGVVVLDANGKIEGFQEKPKRGEEKSKLVNTGIYIFEPEIFDFIPADQFYDFGNNVFPALLAAGKPFYGLQMKGAYWADIGTLPEFRRGTEDVLEGRIKLAGARAVGVPPSAKVAASAKIEGLVRIGERVEIGENVVIEGPSVIGDDAKIGDNAEVRRSILFDGVTVGAASKVTDSIVGLHYAIGEDEWIQDAVMGNEPVKA